MSAKMNEEQLKNLLRINSWRELSKDKLYDFIRLSPNLDKEVYIRIVEQIPNFVTLTSEIIKHIIAIGEQKNSWCKSNIQLSARFHKLSEATAISQRVSKSVRKVWR